MQRSWPHSRGSTCTTRRGVTSWACPSIRRWCDTSRCRGRSGRWPSHLPSASSGWSQNRPTSRSLMPRGNGSAWRRHSSPSRVAASSSFSGSPAAHGGISRRPSSRDRGTSSISSAMAASIGSGARASSTCPMTVARLRGCRQRALAACWGTTTRCVSRCSTHVKAQAVTTSTSSRAPPRHSSSEGLPA